jgi:hypothetical protein
VRAALPWPEGWYAPPFGGCLLTGLLALSGLLLTVAGMGGTIADPAGDGLGVVGAGIVFLAGAAVPAQWFAGGPQPYVRDGALVLPFSRLRPFAAIAAVAAFGLLALAAGRRGEGWGYGVAALAASGVLAALYLRPWWHALVLSPGDVRKEGPRSSVVIPWEQVAGVRAVDREVRSRYGRAHLPMLVVDATDLSSAPLRDIEVHAGRVGIGPVPAYWTLRYYAEHPEARVELADQRAVDRVARGELV